MIYFGFYDFRQLLTLTKRLIRIACARAESNDLAAPSTQESTMRTVRMVFSSSHEVGGAHGSEMPAESTSKDAAMENHRVVLETKLQIIQIVQFVMDVRLDFRMTQLLSQFKSFTQQTDVIFSRAGSSASLDQRLERQSSATDTPQSRLQTQEMEKFVRTAKGMFHVPGYDGAAGSATQLNDIHLLNLDDSFGAALVGTFLGLCMADNVNVVSGALNVLVRNFSQRSELMQAMRGVQLLVSEDDAAVYRIIRTSLDSLRSMVEKSELWVTRSTEDGNGKIHENYEKIKVIFHELTKLCTAKDPDNTRDKDQRKHHQHLLRNLDAHSETMGLLKMPCSRDDEAAKKLRVVAHKFLQAFCLKNKSNQRLLSRNVPFFLETLPANPVVIDTLHAVYSDNVELCRSLQKSSVQAVVNCIETQGRQTRHLKYVLFVNIEIVDNCL